MPRRFRRHGQRHLAGGRDPKLRPADVLPVEFVLMAYPVLDLPPLPEGDEADQGGVGSRPAFTCVASLSPLRGGSVGSEFDDASPI